MTYNGQTFRVNDKRTFSHVVLVSKNLMRLHALTQAETVDRRRLRRDHDVCKTGQTKPCTYLPVQTFQDVKEIARIAAMSLDEFYKEIRAKQKKSFDAREAAGEFEGKNIFAWCGRYDLAQRQLDAAWRQGHRGIEIVATDRGFSGPLRTPSPCSPRANMPS